MSFKTTALTALTVLALVACDKTGSSNSQPVQQPHLGSSGTMDSGGCNGFEKGCLESYSQDVTTLPEYAGVVMPIGERISNLGNFYLSVPHLDSNSKISDPDLPDFFYYLAKMKTWYFVPVSLDQIPSDKLGVPSSTEQLAIQTKNEIWVDANKYKSLSVQARGELLLHELVMELYLMQFETTTEILNRLAVVAPNVKTAESISDRAETDEDEKKNPILPEFKGLQPDDYNNIRAFTLYLLKNSEKMTSQNFIAVAKTYFVRSAVDDAGFDERPYKMSIKLPDVTPDTNWGMGNSRELTVTMKDHMDQLQRMQDSGDVPKKCMVDGWNYRLVPCTVSWKTSILKSIDGKPLGRVDFSVEYQSADGKKVTRNFSSLVQDVVNTWYDPTVNPIYGASQFGMSAVDDLQMFDDFVGNSAPASAMQSMQSVYLFEQRRESDMRIVGFRFEDEVCVSDGNTPCHFKKEALPIYALVDDANPTMVDIAKYRQHSKPN